MGLQKDFSWTEVGAIALTAGMGVATNAYIPGKDVIHAMLRAGVSATTQQLYQLATGTTRQFDLRAVGSAMLSAGLTQGLSHYKPELQMPLSSASKKPRGIR